MKCPECGKELTNEEDCYGHDCEVFGDNFLAMENGLKRRAIQND